MTHGGRPLYPPRVLRTISTGMFSSHRTQPYRSPRTASTGGLCPPLKRSLNVSTVQYLHLDVGSGKEGQWRQGRWTHARTTRTSTGHWGMVRQIASVVHHIISTVLLLLLSVPRSRRAFFCLAWSLCVINCLCSMPASSAQCAVSEGMLRIVLL